jgi:alginate O-acetyltransferase complex protein AlgI
VAFHSVQFVVFLAAVLVLYNAVRSGWRAGLLLLASYGFYAAASVPHLGWLVLVTLVTHAGARVVVRSQTKLALAAVLTIVLLPLVILKYAGFLGQLLNRLQGAYYLSLPALLLPVGISFYTFQAVSYVIDVYRHDVKAVGFRQTALYLAYFPQILAGPIERATKLLPQLALLRPAMARQVYVGAKYMLWGFFCKLAVADNLASLVDRVLTAPQEQSALSLWLTFSLYSFQIYFDFLGYTNIAIGAARCFNVRLSRNFNHPYAATSIRDFWRRWHITLSSWFRDYVYVPLGGRGRRAVGRIGQVMAVFLLSGLWHGAALNFVAWGGFHGAAYLIEKQLRKVFGATPRPLPRAWTRPLRTLATFTVVTVAWVLFRLSQFHDIQVVLARMFFLNAEVPYSALHPALIKLDASVFGGVLLLALVLDGSRRRAVGLEVAPRTSRAMVAELAFCNLLILPVVLLGDLGVRDFIYYRF